MKQIGTIKEMMEEKRLEELAKKRIDTIMALIQEMEDLDMDAEGYQDTIKELAEKIVKLFKDDRKVLEKQKERLALEHEAMIRAACEKGRKQIETEGKKSLRSLDESEQKLLELQEKITQQQNRVDQTLKRAKKYQIIAMLLLIPTLITIGIIIELIHGITYK